MDSDQQRALERAYEADRLALLAIWNERFALMCLVTFAALFPVDPFLPRLPFGYQVVWAVRAGVVAGFVLAFYLARRPAVRARADAMAVVNHLFATGLSAGGLAAVTGGAASLFRENIMASILFLALAMPWKPIYYVMASVGSIAIAVVAFWSVGSVGQLGEFLNFNLILIGCTIGGAIAVYIKAGLGKKVFISGALLEEAHKEMSADLEQARLFQQKLLSTLPEGENIHFAVRYQPATFLGGDFYEVVEMSPQWYRVFLVDVTGHGTQAAIRTVILQQQFVSLSPSCQDPADLLRLINNAVVEAFGPVTVNYCALCVDLRLEGGSWKMRGANAGLPAPTLLQTTRAVMIEDAGAYQGFFVDPEYSTFERTLGPGDSVVLTTDGIIDLFDDGSESSWSALTASLALGPLQGAEQVLEAVMKALPYRDPTHSRADDLTAIAIRV